jgi:hypothetical protein
VIEPVVDEGGPKVIVQIGVAENVVKAVIQDHTGTRHIKGGANGMGE